MSFLWSLVYYTQYEINTVVHLRQIFMENLGAQETAKIKNKYVFIVTRYFIFISSYLYFTFMILNNYR